VLSTAAPVLNYALPKIGALVQVQSGISTADGGTLAGAEVTAVDPQGNALSAPAETQADGGFSLYLPPGTTTYGLQVGPPSDLDGGPLDPLPSYDQLQPAPAAESVMVDLPPVATLQGVVKDSAGTPVAGARVYARSDGMKWSLSRSTVTDANGAYALALRVGSYLVEAAPVAAPDGPAITGEQLVFLPASGTTLNLDCWPRYRGFGLIATLGGKTAAAGYQITATRLADHLLTSRVATTTSTDSAGIWHISADPGRYRVEIVPTADSGLPRKVVQMDLPVPAFDSIEIPMPQIVMSPPLVVAGTVHGAPPGQADQPVANATVSFFAQDANGHGILLGTAPTDAKGQYQVILPDETQPGALRGY
jgi:hypothetical protein